MALSCPINNITAENHSHPCASDRKHRVVIKVLLSLVEESQTHTFSCFTAGEEGGKTPNIRVIPFRAAT